MREKESRAKFLASMQAMRQGQGAVIEAKELAVDYNYSTDGKMIKQLHEVTYQKEIAKEIFIWTIANGKRHSSQLSVSWANTQPLIVEANKRWSRTAGSGLLW